MFERVLVTGADGFVGRQLIPALRAEGCDVLAHTRRDGDIATCRLPYEDVTCVCHLAARTFVPESWRSPREFYQTNLGGTLNVLEFCRLQPAFLILMSSYVYGRPKRLPIDESHPVEAFNPYAHSKLLAEDAVRFYAEKFDVSTAIIRPFNLYGPGQASHFLIPTLIAEALKPGDTISVADPRPRRDFLHVCDLVALLARVLARRATGVFNAGSGSSTSIQRLVELINLYNQTHKRIVSTSQVRENEILDTVADCTRARNELQWEPQISIEDGIRQLMTTSRCDRS